MDIHIRTKIRYQYSYIEAAVVRIGNETLEVGSFGEHFLNGVDGGLQEPGAGLMTLSGFPVTYTTIDKKQHLFEIHVRGNEKIVLKTFNDMVSVGMKHADPSRFEDSVGMMGDFKTGVLYGRDELTVIDNPNDLADEWQVSDREPMLFQTIRYPHYPEKCVLPGAHVLGEKRQRLGNPKATEEASEACAHIKDENSKKACVSDVILTGDPAIARV